MGVAYLVAATVLSDGAVAAVGVSTLESRIALALILLRGNAHPRGPVPVEASICDERPT